MSFSNKTAMVTKSRWGAWLAVVVALLLAVAGIGLGVWQLGRAQEKQDLMDRRLDRANLMEPGEVRRWQPTVTADDLDQQRIRITGRWLHDKTIALDNRARDGQAGVHILTPVLLNDLSILWVNRGWLAKPPGVMTLPAIPVPTDPVGLEAVMLGSVMKRMELSSNPDQLRQGPLWQNFDWDAAEAWLPGDAWPVIAWQISDNGDGLVRAIPEVRSDVPKHMGYATQWFLLTALALFFAWRLRPRSRHAQEQ
jgi:surfeit locus 1 family protein